MSLNRRTNHHATSYIYAPDKQPIKWPLHQGDPYIYVSFSYALFQQFFEKQLFDRRTDLPEIMQLQAFDPDVIALLQKIAETEWLEKAELPIRFLTSDSHEILDKNVYFILADLNLDSERAYTFMTTYPHLTNMRFTALQDIKTDTITPKDIYMFLHESMHGILGAKHFRPYDPGDYAPFITEKSPQNDLDCAKTVMAYEEDCKVVVDHPIPTHVLDGEGDLLFIKNLPNPFNYPTTLGELDIEAARLFNERWFTEHSALDITETQASMSKPSSTALVLRKLTQVVNYSLNKAERAVTAYAESVVSGCPSYFPPPQSSAHLNFWSTSTPYTNESLCPLISVAPPALGYSPTFLLD